MDEMEKNELEKNEELEPKEAAENKEEPTQEEAPVTDAPAAEKAVETAEELIRRYQVQLDYYAQALERLTGKSVKEKLIYSFALSREIRLW